MSTASFGRPSQCNSDIQCPDHQIWFHMVVDGSVNSAVRVKINDNSQIQAPPFVQAEELSFAIFDWLQWPRNAVPAVQELN